MNIIVSDEIEQVCPGFVGACVEADVVNTPYCEGLWKEIHELGEHYKATLTTESLKELSGIQATRRVYKACGKDPSRYRPASEHCSCSIHITDYLISRMLFLIFLEVFCLTTVSQRTTGIQVRTEHQFIRTEDLTGLCHKMNTTHHNDLCLCLCGFLR